MCLICREQTLIGSEQNIILRQTIERIMFKCYFCETSYKYGEAHKHAEACKGLNYTCPNDGCGHSQKMAT
jgi:hypothetical protein